MRNHRGFLRDMIWLETQGFAGLTAILRGIRVESDAFLSRILTEFEPAIPRIAGQHRVSGEIAGHSMAYTSR